MRLFDPARLTEEQERQLTFMIRTVLAETLEDKLAVPLPKPHDEEDPPEKWLRKGTR